jgi:hypothetical protein
LVIRNAAVDENEVGSDGWLLLRGQQFAGRCVAITLVIDN